MRGNKSTVALSSLTRPLAVLLAACTMLVPTVVSVSAPSLASATTAPPCSALTTTLPFTVSGEPLSGNGEAGFNVELTNTTQSTCSLYGWPTLSVAATPSQAPVAVDDVSYTDIATVQSTQLSLVPQSSAVFTVIVDNRNCLTAPWTLDLALSSGGPSSLIGASDSSTLCLSPTLHVSPYYSLSTFTSLMSLATSAPSSGSPYAIVTGPEPSTCTSSDATATFVSSSVFDGMSALVLRLQASGGASCTLSGLYPLVQLVAGSATEAAKVWYSGAQPSGITSVTFRNFGTAANPHVAAVLSGSASAYVTVVASSTPSAAGSSISDGGAVIPVSPSQCISPQSLTVFGTAYADGIGLPLTLPQAITLCGQPEEFTYTASPLSSAALSAAASALSPTGINPPGDSPAGFYYGSDGTFTYSESPVGGYYKEPYNSGSNYGGYLGNTAYWYNETGYSYNCGSPFGLDYSTTMDSYAVYNKTQHNLGAGLIDYYMAAGPGREPSGISDQTWGIEQAEMALGGVTNFGDNSPYVIMDIEPTAGPTAPDNGWSTQYNGPCGTTGAGSVTQSRNVTMFNGWWDYLDSPDSAYLPAAYETGYSCTGCAGWSNYFGSKLLLNTNEWTYDYETSNVGTFPIGWTLGTLTPFWFAEPSPPATKCYFAWQWTGGDTQNTDGARLDQIDLNDQSCV